MAFISQEQRIQRALLQEAEIGPFYPVRYDRLTQEKSVDVGILVKPAERIAQAISSSFGNPLRHRRTFRQERRTWRWHLACRFEGEVSLEDFEKRITKTPVMLARDSDNDLEQVTLRLLESDPFHPPQQAPSTGTEVTFVFEAELSPV